jgi:drug/metabolite transporter (DMT)-like permease
VAQKPGGLFVTGPAENQQGIGPLRVAALVTVAMLAFAANSILARLALGTGSMSPASFAGVRLMSGALTLAALLYLHRRRNGGPTAEINGSWRGAAALSGYALTFALAYVMLGASTGALILFASVQIGMLAWAILKGDRPGLLEWLGFGIAFGALVFLVAPGLVAPPLLGTVLMVIAGLCWAAYSLLGQGSRAPLADTAGNFIRCLPIAVVLWLAGEVVHASTAGVVLAIISGVVASGMGYAIWYTALPTLTRTGAAFVQLTVPPIAAAGGVLFIGEQLTGRLLLSSAGILGGVALALLAANRRKIRADGASV